MRVISGSLKGQQLIGFKNSNIRPTTDRVKESLFNKLMGEVEGARVLDLYGGTGNLSIEFFSRGAVHVDCVESHRSSLKVIQANLQKMKIQNGVTVHLKDVFAYLKSYSADAYDIVMADPPFTQKIAHETMQALADSKVWGPQTTLVIEASAHERMEDVYASLCQYDRREFGDKTVFFFCQKD